ncbi:AurF N-oxygenase family protein [Sciscionella sediminilitoris]|uniref:AurF N-oxygenase family protein n=1 Tax=Sciscionella sediminilitoris TaxID=1445613 RepID=UPI0004DF0004|nr:diiron oxygenase [Sciscionella sp. SE31]
MTRAMSSRGEVAEREKTASRLLKSSANKFYDPDVDIDWGAPVDGDKYFVPPHRSTLYGTKLWDQLTEEQRVELTKHEFASVASNGLWFETLLMQMLLKSFYNTDPTQAHAQYMLTEVADECRHSTMFAKACERVGAPAYGPVPWLRQLAKILPLIAYGPAKYGAILIAEEILDRLQREMMSDEQIEPLVRMVNRIHVLEEARHVTFAREEVQRGMPKLGKLELLYQQLLISLVSLAIMNTLINPKVYAAVGIDPKEGRRAAARNPYWQETCRWAGERIMPFLDESGLIGRITKPIWRRANLLKR